MSDIKVGDRVQWYRISNGTLQTGTLLQEPVRGHEEWPVSVKPDNAAAYNGVEIVTLRFSRLTRISPTELVRAVQALPQDDERREQAISSLRLFADPIDYDLMLKVGDLGGVEFL